MPRFLSMAVLAVGLIIVGCGDEGGQVAGPTHDVSLPAPATKAAAAGGLVIDSFDQGAQEVIPDRDPHLEPGWDKDLYTGSGPIGGRRELAAGEGHAQIKTEFHVSGTSPGDARIVYPGTSHLGSTQMEFRYGSCIGVRTQVIFHRVSCSDPGAMAADFSNEVGIAIDFDDLDLGSAAFMVAVVVRTANGKTFSWRDRRIPYQQGPSTLEISFEDFSDQGYLPGNAPTPSDLASVTGLVVAMGNFGTSSYPANQRSLIVTELRTISGSVPDSDGDGVPDDVDACADTPEGALIDADGCSGLQNVARTCPADDEYRNHGAYVSCVAHAAQAQVLAGLLSETEKGAVVSAAGRSSIGKKNNGGRKK